MVAFGPFEIAVALLLVVAIAGAAAIFVRNGRSAALRDRFGEEYRRTLAPKSGASALGLMLDERERGMAGPRSWCLSPGQRDAFIAAWRQVQSQFVTDAAGAVKRADTLLTQVMLACGYPVADLEPGTEDQPVEHSELIVQYRTGHAIAQAHASGQGGIEELRWAFVHFRALFDDLVNEPVDFSPVIENRNGRVHDLRKETTRRN
ncbi:hypothetical protein [Novosphingobium soli]|uniref:Secreted protein n=1 Tax=Novosphingobium soli TaxID=574956 RepID=A0ABV6D141_9SPHN